MEFRTFRSERPALQAPFIQDSHPSCMAMATRTILPSTALIVPVSLIDILLAGDAEAFDSLGSAGIGDAQNAALNLQAQIPVPRPGPKGRHILPYLRLGVHSPHGLDAAGATAVGNGGGSPGAQPGVGGKGLGMASQDRRNTAIQIGGHGEFFRRGGGVEIHQYGPALVAQLSEQVVGGQERIFSMNSGKTRLTEEREHHEAPLPGFKILPPPPRIVVGIVRRPHDPARPGIELRHVGLVVGAVPDREAIHTKLAQVNRVLDAQTGPAGGGVGAGEDEVRFISVPQFRKTAFKGEDAGLTSDLADVGYGKTHYSQCTEEKPSWAMR
ncbi:hypothetical protein TRIP_E100040 [uncultured Spirochaetota bacterium]|nr:hypothetical protein TRIP_E100040 [uncultured Spirochaetota bacterium]